MGIVRCEGMLSGGEKGCEWAGRVGEKVAKALAKYGKKMARFLTHQSDISENVTAGAEGMGWRAK